MLNAVTTESSINQLTISGIVANTPQLTYTQKRTAFCFFTLNINSGNNGNSNSSLRIITTNSLAEFLYHRLTKGAKILVRGKLQLNPYSTQTNGNLTCEVLAESVRNLENNTTNNHQSRILTTIQKGEPKYA